MTEQKGIEFRLQKRQGDVLKTPANDILYGGSAGSGKSALNRILAIIFCLSVPDIQVYIMRKTVKELFHNYVVGSHGLLRLLDPYIKAGKVKYQKQSSRFEFWNGAAINLAYCANESDLDSLLGQEMHVILIDEAVLFEESWLRFLRTRNRIGGLEVPAKFKDKLPLFLMATNPRGVSAGYLKRAYVDYGSDVVHRAPESEGGTLRVFIEAKVADNKILLQNDPTYVSKLKQLGSKALVDAYLHGDWSASDTRAIPAFQPETHVIDADGRDFPFGFTKTVGFDYGHSAPAVALWIAKTNGETFLLNDGTEMNLPPDSLIIFDEDYHMDIEKKGLKLSTFDAATRIKNVTARYNNVKYGPADRSIFDTDRNQNSIAKEYADAGVKWTPSNKKPGTRISGLQLINDMMNETLKPYKERPCMLVTANCVDLIQEIMDLQLDGKKEADVDTKQHDHGYDALRYLVLQSSMEVKFIKVTGV